MAPAKIDPRSYPVEVFWDDGDKGFIAAVPDLPGCSAFGGDEAEAIAEVRVAIEAWIEAARAAGNPIPKPSEPAAEEYSGKFVLRMPKSLHAQLARRAKAENSSLNSYVVYLVTTANAQMAVTPERQKAAIAEMVSSAEKENAALAHRLEYMRSEVKFALLQATATSSSGAADYLIGNPLEDFGAEVNVMRPRFETTSPDKAASILRFLGAETRRKVTP